MKKEIKKGISAGGVVRKMINNKIYIVLIKEVDMPGYSWVLPKGHQENGETLEQTAEREIKEETGLKKIKIGKKLGIKERLSFEKNELKTIHYFMFDCEDSSSLSSVNEDEGKIMRVEWFSLNNLPKLFFKEQEKIINNNLEILKS